MHATLLSSIVDTLGKDAFSGALMRWLYSSVPFDGFVVLGYPNSGELIVFHDGAPGVDSVSCNSIYRGGMWLFSPLHLHAKQGGQGFFHISDIIGSNFETSRFYNSYYNEVGIKDHVAYICQNGEGEAIVVSLERSHDLPLYSKEEIKWLSDWQPMVTSLLRRHWAGLENQNGIEKDLYENAKVQVRKLVYDKKLTPREEDALLAILKGLPNKLVARELGISVETVKVYCTKIMRKFGVNSRAELFASVLKQIVSSN
ncbi:helix-turn-helix transcriptional regulator [Parahaliea maris]|uniref:Helix-turn-helix transcriptional regulator n=1 Tax=Parahaliea maris TaxID=2716870 RepID=A0A5C8ZPE1_9GAMM|nr:helix-turn-helix transcriptional regulator [Parahaliea maris]TXS90323.1 helix-turn-helix transcriptional regulator [Parahaliea maris]